MTSELPDLPANNPPRTKRADLKYRHKTSFYQDEADAKRMRAAFMNTMQDTGYNSLSDFINAAVDDKVAALERTYNDGQRWTPLAAREIPQGKPVGRSVVGLNAFTAPEMTGGHKPPAKALVALLAGKKRADLAKKFGNGEVDVFYGATGREALVVAHNCGAARSTVHSFELSPAQNSIFVRTADDVAWIDGPVRRAPGRNTLPGEEDLHWPEEPAKELVTTVERERTGLEKTYSKPLDGQVGVFYGEDGTQALLDTFDTGEQMSTLRRYRLDPADRTVEVWTSEGFSWEHGEDIPLTAI